ncbi:hypothetical protein ACH5RR_017904 [Cinchona calisaya]|uniref:E3 ubiquitin-protein ligase RMA n=1 Tax=Cinchona calisaya TaxID=153742 RepID=A0ABD2ZJX4_9GENT
MEFEQQLVQELKSMPASIPDQSEKVSGCFDCSICLDSARDPVVTLCGHLYCWPCIYKWLEFQQSSSSLDQCSHCPICKAEISQESVVPLYGRGGSLSEAEPDQKSTSLNKIIPPRPNAVARQAQTTSSTLRQRLPSNSPYQNLQTSPQPIMATNEESVPVSPLLSNLESPTAMGVCHPMNGNYGEMVYARVFGNSRTLYTFPNSYHTEGSTSPRLRRQEIQAYKSLNRISVFLFCSILLCVFLF